MTGIIRLPVFVDAHAHLCQTGLALRGLDLTGTTSRTELLDRLSTYAEKSDDAVLLGTGWDETGWPNPTLPTLAELDRAAPGRVVQLSRVDGHSGLVSSAVLERAPELADAVGWDGSGRTERAANHVARRVVDGLISREQRRAAIARALDAAAAVGIGCVHEMSATHINPTDDLTLIRELAAERTLPEVVPYWGEHVADGGVERAMEFGCAGAAGDLNVDGALGSRTAALREPYADASDHRGHVYLDADAVAEHVVACTRAGLQAGFHCIGDGGTSAAAEGFRIAARTLGVDALVAARHRLEHVELISADDLHVLAECGVVVSAQPAFDAFWGGASGMYARRLGAARALATNPFAAIARLGITIAFGSDSPVTPFDPWGGVRAAVLHHEPTSRVGVADAFAAHTQAGWYAARREPLAGSYAEWEVPGGLDDNGLPVLDTGTPLPTCVRTVVGGRTVYDRADRGAVE